MLCRKQIYIQKSVSNRDFSAAIDRVHQFGILVLGVQLQYMYLGIYWSKKVNSWREFNLFLVTI